jgi:hypothetical protein
MDPLDVLRAHIAAFPGYDGVNNQRLADEFVRSYLGEALVDGGGGNVELPADVQSRIEALLLRVGFADPKSFAAHGVLTAPRSADGGEVAIQDAATVEIADRVRSVAPASLNGVLDEVTQTLDRREAAMRAAAMPAQTS